MNPNRNTYKSRQEKADLFNLKLTGAMMAALKAIHSAASPDSMDR